MIQNQNSKHGYHFYLLRETVTCQNKVGQNLIIN